MKHRTETGQKSTLRTFTKFGKDDVRYWKNRLKRRSYKNGGVRCEIKEWQVRLHSRGAEEWFNLGTQNRNAAAKKARDIYLFMRSNGMAEAIAQFKTKPLEKWEITTFGDYVEAVRKLEIHTPETFNSYLQKTRQIISEIMGVSCVPKKDGFDKSGRKKWRAKVAKYKLVDITPEKVEAWRRSYVRRAGNDPLKRKKVEHTANSCLRNAKSLFGKRVLKQLGDFEMPAEIPFQDVEFYRQRSFRYRSNVDIGKLIEAANAELREENP